MFPLKQKVFELRKSGLSYRQIQKETGVSLSTLSLWFQDQEWSKQIGQNLLLQSAKEASKRLNQFKKARGFALQFSYARAKEDAEKEYKKLKKDPLFFAGLMLYWAAGDQASLYYCRLRSAEPLKINLFRRWLEESLNISPTSIKYSLVLSKGQQAQEIEEKWARDAKIPLQSFTKSTFLRKKKGKDSPISSVCTATHSSRYLKEKMLVWLRLLADEFRSAGMVLD